jgi:hypothetical protein
VDAPADDAADNPFSTRYVRPGAIPFQFAEGESAARIVSKLREGGWRGEIVGPHGAGKSSLVQALLPAIRDAGRTPRLVQLRAGDRALPMSWRELADCLPETVIVVDGYEQLSRYCRWRLGRLCARRGFGLLTTSHERSGLPQLYRFSPGRAALHRVVEHLLRGRSDSGRRIAAADVDQAFDECRGDIREALFRLYDVWESRRSEPPSGTFQSASS